MTCFTPSLEVHLLLNDQVSVSGSCNNFLRSAKGVWVVVGFFSLSAIVSRQPFSVQDPGVLVVVAVDAQQLPVAAVGRIVPVIMVFVMDRQLAQFFAGKITAAFCADPWEDLQGLFSVLNFFHVVFFAA